MAQKKPMGIGIIGQPDIVFKRQFRFTFELFGFCNNQKNLVPEHFVSVAARPHIKIDETEINYLNGKFFIPGKATPEPISVTYHDVAHEQMRPLYSWLATVYNYMDPVNLTMGNKRDYGGMGVITLFDGCGTPLETWELKNVWPTDIDFGKLDYASAETATIELSIRYSDVKFTSLCPAFAPSACCTGCG